jgi:flagellar hook-basal body complex protein FliE
MSPLGSINPLSAGASPLTRIIDAPPAGKPSGISLGQGPATGPTTSFSEMLDGVVSTVESKSVNAQDATRQVLLGESSQLHQSMIAMQEASVAFSMMIEVRNKLVESYQELMRMQV